jgi:hypothetical protein
MQGVLEFANFSFCDHPDVVVDWFVSVKTNNFVTALFCPICATVFEDDVVPCTIEPLYIGHPIT